MYMLVQPKSTVLKLAWWVIPDIASGPILEDVFALVFKACGLCLF